MPCRFASFVLLVVASCCGLAQPAKSKQAPPPGVEIPDTDRLELTDSAAELGREIEALRRKLSGEKAALLPDVIVFHKAVDWALRHDEFMDVKHVGLAKKFLAEGFDRAKDLRSGQAPWTTQTGSVIRGYVSRIDDSVQPYGVIVPTTWTPDKKVPLLVWLAGRNDKRTELAFLNERAGGKSEFTPKDTIVLHPYGRWCNATKFAGETDVFEAMASVRERYRIDPNRIAVAGFSMGGASCWHLAVHHAGLWCAASPGAGFAETAIYAKVFAPGKSEPTAWEQKLWAQYDATKVAANLFNVPITAYSGGEDPQKQSADIMEKACATEGVEMKRIIGPGVGHKYEAGAKKELAAWLDERMAEGRQELPPRVRFSTYTLRYPTMEWIKIDRLAEHWQRADVDAELVDEGTIRVTTKNVAAFTISLPVIPPPLDPTHPPRVVIDGQELTGPPVVAKWTARFCQMDGKWQLQPPDYDAGIHKHHGLTGPIDDAFTDRFIFVRPTGQAWNPDVGAWSKSELERAIVEWRRVFRGDAIVKNDTDLTPAETASANLILWGDPGSNRIIAQILDQLPLTWTKSQLSFAGNSLDAAHHAPVLVFPNPLNPQRYIVLNSSFTFREGATVSNSLQTPKLPDWALIDVSVEPTEKSPGGVVAAGFFNEDWQLPNK